jgi:hypothetical protein
MPKCVAELAAIISKAELAFRTPRRWRVEDHGPKNRTVLVRIRGKTIASVQWRGYGYALAG